MGNSIALLSDDILEAHTSLVVVKSISKSYGVPGLRLGVMATANREMVEQMRALLPIWNINSFAEYFLQIYSLYKNSYFDACDKIAEQRAILTKELQKISFLKVYPSQANYIMCRVLDKFGAKELATKLLNESKLLIKDLSAKNGFNNETFIRVAVKDKEENDILIETLKMLDN